MKPNRPYLLLSQAGTWREPLQGDPCRHQCWCRTDKPGNKWFCWVEYFVDNWFTWISLSVAPSILSSPPLNYFLAFYIVFSDTSWPLIPCFLISLSVQLGATISLLPLEVSSIKLSVSLKTDSLEHHLIRCSTRSHNLNVFQPSVPVFNWGLPYVYCHRMREVWWWPLIWFNSIV